MGFKDLLYNLNEKELQRCSVADFYGMSIAIDASEWLRKAVYNCTEETIDANFKDYMFYVDFLLTRTRNFRLAGVEPVMVFDGMRSPFKSESQFVSEVERVSNLEQGKTLLECIKNTEDSVCKAKLRNEAIACFQRGLTVTHEIERNTIAALRRVGVTVVVAPSRAGAQLVYLCHTGICRAALTEDPDVIVYSALCGTPFPILYKFDSSGTVQAVSLRTLNIHTAATLDTPQKVDVDNLQKENSPNENAPESQTSKLSYFQRHFAGASNRRLLVHMCILAGCTYSEELPGIGLEEAIQICVRFKDIPDDNRLARIVRHLEEQGITRGRRCTAKYLENALRAEALFFYHPVYDPRDKQVRRLSVPRLISHTISGDICKEPCGLPPLIDDADLERTGGWDDLLSGAPDDVGVSDVCEGRCSLKGFTTIDPLLPWEIPELRPPESVHSRGRRLSRGNVWMTRSCLVRSLAQHIPAECESSSGTTPAKSADTSVVRDLLSDAFSHCLDTGRPSRRVRKSSAQAVLTSLNNDGIDDSCIRNENDLNGEENILQKNQAQKSNTCLTSSLIDNCRTPPTSSVDTPNHSRPVDKISPDYSRLVVSEAETSPVKELDPELERPDVCANKGRVKRKQVDTVVVPACRATKGKKQKTMMVASIKSYFATPR